MLVNELRSKRLVEKWYSINDGTRSLFESAVIPEVAAALSDFQKGHGANKGVLIGGLAVSFYGLPRATTDVDFLFLSAADIPEQVDGFKRTRPGAFQHNKTHVEIEVLAPPSINLDPELVKQVFDTAQVMDGIRVASKSGLVALKLNRLKRYDSGDIAQLIATGEVDLTPFDLSQQQLDAYQQIVQNEQT